jgi:hypothetical protein
MLQDLITAQKYILEKDFFAFKLFIRSMREGKADHVDFRVKDVNQKIHWLRMEGIPDSEDSTIYYGYIEDITTAVLRAIEYQSADNNESPSIIAENFNQKLETLLKDQNHINTILKIFYQNRPLDFGLDVLIFFDVFIRKDKIKLYYASEKISLSDDELTYSGSLAEELVRSGQDNMIVADTTQSTNPSDWAFFVHNGIRSYHAKPFYSRKVLRTVLIFGSLNSNIHSGDAVSRFTFMCKPLLNAIKNWRRSHS